MLVGVIGAATFPNEAKSELVYEDSTRPSQVVAAHEPEPQLRPAPIVPEPEQQPSVSAVELGQPNQKVSDFGGLPLERVKAVEEVRRLYFYPRADISSGSGKGLDTEAQQNQ